MRVLRWQLQLQTTAPPDHDERMEKALRSELELLYGPSFKLVRLKTKE